MFERQRYFRFVLRGEAFPFLCDAKKMFEPRATRNHQLLALVYVRSAYRQNRRANHKNTRARTTAPHVAAAFHCPNIARAGVFVMTAAGKT